MPSLGRFLFGWRRPLRILYISVHAVLEYDDVTMLRSLGNTVFPLGLYFAGGRAQTLRPALPWGAAEAALLKHFEARGCRYAADPDEMRLDADFVRAFDLTIVMHEPAILERHWSALAVRPVVWRTIGQKLLQSEARLAPLRARGLRILRYSETERRIPGYLGGEGLVRFHKDPAEFERSTVSVPQVLAFAHRFVQRYPREYAVFRAATAGLPVALGGEENEGLPGSIGMVDYDQQLRLLRTSRAYLYCSGLAVPYTLNFIEAWISGVPVVALDEEAVLGRPGYSEIPHLIRHGENGFLARDAAEARGFLAALLADSDLARRIGGAGRIAATRLFGSASVAGQWRAVLPKLAAPAPSGGG